MAVTSTIKITLDTTPPTLTLSMPTMTTNKQNEIITILSNEKLDSNYEIFIIDSLGNKTNPLFNLQNNKMSFVGNISFVGMPLGKANLFVRLQDEVLNKTSLYSKTIEIFDVLPTEADKRLQLTISEMSREQILEDKNKKDV